MYYTLIYNINICKVNLSSDGKNNKCKCNHIQMDFVPFETSLKKQLQYWFATKTPWYFKFKGEILATQLRQSDQYQFWSKGDLPLK